MSILKSTCSGIYAELTVEVLQIKGYQQRGDDIFSVEYFHEDYPGFVIKIWPGAKLSFFTFSDPDTDAGKIIRDVAQLEKYEAYYRKKV